MGSSNEDKLIADQSQIYALILHDGPGTAKLSAIRTALGVGISDVAKLRESMPGVVRRGARSELLPILDQLHRRGVRAELRASSEFPDPEDILSSASTGLSSISIPLADADFVPMKQWRLRWRFTDPKHGVLPAKDLEHIRPLCPAKARLAWNSLLFLLEVKDGTPSLSPAYFEKISSIDTSAEPEAVRIWLQSQLPSHVREVLVSWQPDEAVVTTADVFCRHWDDFCYPGSDDVMVWSLHDDWAWFYWHEEQMFAGSRQRKQESA
jgi:hypothetical protein